MQNSHEQVPEALTVPRLLQVVASEYWHALPTHGEKQLQTPVLPSLTTRTTQCESETVQNDTHQLPLFVHGVLEPPGQVLAHCAPGFQKPETQVAVTTQK